VTLNGGGVANERYDDVTIENGGLDAYEVPILLSGANRNVIRKVEAHSATFGSYLLDADSNKIVHSRGGFYVDERSDGNLLSSDEFTGLDGDVLEGDRNVIADSHVDVNDEGVSISGDQNLVTRTTVVEGRGFGIVVESGEGNVLSRNQLLGARGDGIGIEAAAQHTLVRSNSASGNTDDGIQADSAGTTLIRNVATGNGDLGIESVPGVIAEGNFARGNGNPLQCLNVACRG
jgi:parallel beta-helix repeat protein